MNKVSIQMKLFIPFADTKQLLQEIYSMSTKPTKTFFNFISLALFLFIIGIFKQSIQFYYKLLWRNVHPVIGAGILSQDLLNTGLLP